MSITEVLPCPILSPTPPCSPHPMRPCCSCRPCWPPNGEPIGPPPVRPGRDHAAPCLRAHAEVLPALAEWTDETHAVLGDLGYEGEQAALTTPVKKATGRPLSDDERTVNALHAATRA